MLKKFFLPGGMLAAVILSFFVPEAGIQVKKICGSTFFIVAIFLVCGWQTELKGINFNRKFFFSLAGCGLLSLLAAPYLGVGIAKILKLDNLAMTGLVVMASVPPTLSSGIVMTETARGNVVLGMIMTVFYNLAGVITLPLVLSWTLAGCGNIDTNPLKMFIQLLLLVILPFAAGAILKKLSGKNLPPVCSYIPSLCVILLILSFFSSANQQFRIYPLPVLCLSAAGGLIMRLGLMAVLWYGGKLFNMDIADRKAAIFTAGSKTLTIALATLAIMDAGDGPAVIPCMVFYFLQSLIDSALAGKFAAAPGK